MTEDKFKKYSNKESADKDAKYEKTPEEEMMTVSQKIQGGINGDKSKQEALDAKLKSLSDEDKKKLIEAQLKIQALTQGQLTNGKLVFLVLLSLAVSTFGPLAFFAAFPLSMVLLLYKEVKAYVVMACGFTFLVALATKGIVQPEFCYIYLISIVLSFGLIKTIELNMHPVRAMLTLGVGLLTLVGLGVFFVTTQIEGSFLSEIERKVTEAFVLVREQNNDVFKAGGKEARLLDDLLSSPKEVARNLYNWAPSAIFVGIFLICWGNILLVLRNKIFWQQMTSYKYNAKALTKFKVPENLVWLLIICLAAFLVGDYFKEGVLSSEWVKILSGNILYCLGIFYFFQGFGIYLDFLSFLGINGFFRSVLVVITFMAAWKYVAIVGVLDLWVNFRKFFKKKLNK